MVKKYFYHLYKLYNFFYGVFNIEMKKVNKQQTHIFN